MIASMINGATWTQGAQPRITRITRITRELE